MKTTKVTVIMMFEGNQF